MYSFGRKSGLPLQPRFRTVRHVQKGDQESFGRLEMERDGTQQGFWLGPSLIDGSFQASMALADAAVGIGTLKIPLSIRRLQPCGRKYSIAVWSYFQLIDFTDRWDKSTVFRSWLLNDAGEALLYFDHVHLQEVRGIQPHRSAEANNPRYWSRFLCCRRGCEFIRDFDEEDEEDEMEVDLRPKRGNIVISEEEFESLQRFIAQMMQKTRRSELLYFLAVPSIATIGGFFTTAEDGFPFIFYAMYLPLLVISKSLEVFLLRRWQQVDLTSAEIQTQQWESMGFGHPIALLICGSLEHADLFLDVVFIATSASCGYVKLSIAAGVTLLLSVCLFWNVSVGHVCARSKCLYSFGAGMQWLAATCRKARFGDSEHDMGLEDNRTSNTIILEQIPQMLLQATYFRFVLVEMSLQARLKQWLSVGISIAVLLAKTRKWRKFAVPARLGSLLVVLLMFPAEMEEWLYDVLWRPTELQSKGAAQALVLGSSSALQKLNAEGVRCEELPMEEQALMSLLQSEPWSTVVLADGLLTQSAWAETPPVGALPGGELSDVAVLNRAMALTKAIAKMGVKAPLLVFATWGAQPLASEELHARRAGRPDHSGLWGFARAVRMEYPGALRLTCVDLDASKDSNQEASAWTQLNAAVSSLGDEEEVALREEAKCARLARSVVKYTGALRLNMPARGSLTGLRCVPQADTAKGSAVAPTMAQLRIRAVGLNFRDVLNVMGLYPGDPGPPGADCGATVLGLGENVKHLRLAEDVFGESPGCLSTYNTSSAALLTQKPSSWSYEEACCMPVIFVTVEEALGDLAQLKRGERVLIHAAAGGVGLVAIQYAKFIGAEVYATAGAEEKHEFLRKMGVKYITSSRNGNKFEEDMKNFLKEMLPAMVESLVFGEQGADGLDVVLNSLSHDDYIGRSLALLKPGGRFVEIGKRGIWSHKQMFEARPDVMHTFEGLEKGVQALQFLQRASNIGKVVISSASRLGCDAFSMPLLSGGLGALGVVTATFLVEKCDVGVEDSVVALRDSLKKGGANFGEVPKRLELWAPGVQLGALMHLAGVLADGVLPSLTLESLEKSYAPKVHGLLHLARHLNFQKTAPHLLFSSTSALFGSPGQANYSASNSLLDSLAAFWSSQETDLSGDPTSSLWRNARSVQWGPWAEVGMAVQANTLGRAKSMGVGAVTNSQGLAIMNSILSSSNLSAYPQVPNFLKDFEAEAKKEAAEARAARGERESGGGAGMAALAGLSPEERLEAVRHTLRDLAREVIDSADLEADNPLMESGMDSLSGVEFRNRLQTEFDGVNLPNSMVFDYPTVTDPWDAADGEGPTGRHPFGGCSCAIRPGRAKIVGGRHFRRSAEWSLREQRH
eukprot:g2683.t1